MYSNLTQAATLSSCTSNGPQSVVKVTGLSMFYALLALATNVMAQPTGRVCNAPAHINAQLRISPIECAADTLLMIGQWLYHSYHSGKFRKGARVVITQRFFFDDKEPGHISDLQGSSLFRALLGFLTTTQAVKIFCSQNVLLAKIWAGIYVAHWLCGEILIIMKKKINMGEDDADHRFEIHSHGPGSVAWVVVAVTALFPLSFGALGLSGLAKSMGQDWNSIQCIGLVILVFGCIPFTIVSLFTLYGAGNLRSCSLSLLAVVVPALMYLIPLGFKSAANLHNSYAHIVTGTLAAVWAAFGLLWAAKTISPRIGDREYARCLETWLSWWLVAIHLVSAYLFYTYGYDTQGKIRPSWSQKLDG